MAHKFTESTVEDAALDWFAELGYATASGPDLLPDGIAAERTSLAEVVLWSRLRDALTRINRKLPEAAIDEALRKLASNDAVLLIDRNHRSHDALVNGLDVEYQKGDGSIGYEKVRLVAFDRPADNDFLVANQVTVVDGQHHRRPDLVVFLNGLPIALVELKNAADEDADIEGAFRQIQTYRDEIPALFEWNEISAISDGQVARAGSFTADFERFSPWRTIEGEKEEPRNLPPTATISTTSSSRRSPIATSFCARSRSRRRIGSIFNRSCAWPRAAWCSRPSRSSFPRSRGSISTTRSSGFARNGTATTIARARSRS